MTETHHALEKIIMHTFVMDNIDYVVYVVIFIHAFVHDRVTL